MELDTIDTMLLCSLHRVPTIGQHFPRNWMGQTHGFRRQYLLDDSDMNRTANGGHPSTPEAPDLVGARNGPQRCRPATSVLRRDPEA